MAFAQGLSGLNVSSKGLDVVGNNIANASTVGFKSSNAQFADVYTASLNGRASQQVGVGAAVASVFQQFTQGNLTTTENALDIAINGAGFFNVMQGGTLAYTRNGQFHNDLDGYIVNDQGYKLLGYPASETGQIATGAAAPIQIDAGSYSARATSEARMLLNVDASKEAPAIPFNAANPASYTYSTMQTFYDAQGSAHNVTYYFVKGASGDPRPWEVHATLDGGAAEPMGQLEFDSNGRLASTPSALALPASWTDFSGLSVDFAGSTSFAGLSTVNSQFQDGFAEGQLKNITMGSNGILMGNYSNGQSKPIAQIVLSTFRDMNGLIRAGDNLFLESQASGPPTTGAPEMAGRGQLRSLAVEDSNVDLTNELVNMITLQRNYQANAQVIKTQDQIMQTLSNMR